MRKIKVGDKLICLKERLGFKKGNFYEVTFVSGRKVSIKNELGMSMTYYLDPLEEDCVIGIWEEFGHLKDLRKQKIEKILHEKEEE